MDKGRRGFLKGAAAGTAGVTGWLLFGKGAEAKTRAKGNRIIREFDETVEGIPHHVIEMQLSYDNPMLQFEVTPPADSKPGNQAFRQTVCRHTATDLLVYDRLQTGKMMLCQYDEAVARPAEDLWPVIRKRVPLMAKALPAAVIFAVPPLPDQGSYVTTVVCHCPAGIEVGMTVTVAARTSKDMHLTIPATLLPKG